MRNKYRIMVTVNRAHSDDIVRSNKDIISPNEERAAASAIKPLYLTLQRHPQT